MPHRVMHFGAAFTWFAGLGGWLASRAAHVAQVASDPSLGSMTDAAGTGSIAVLISGAFMALMKYLTMRTEVLAKAAEAATAERERIRQAEQADKERANREALARLDRDARLAALEREAANARSDAAKVARELDAKRERDHHNAGEIQRILWDLTSQMGDNTAAVNLMLPAIRAVSERLGEHPPLPDPVQPLVETRPPPDIHIKPTPGELARKSGDEIPARPRPDANGVEPGSTA